VGYIRRLLRAYRIGCAVTDATSFARPGYDEFGKISLDENGEALGLLHGLEAVRRDRGFRCAECDQYQRAGSWLVWVEDGLRKDDPDWAFEDSAIYRGGNWSGSGWCLDCAPKRRSTKANAKATPTRSAKTTKIGLVRRMAARCRKAFAQISTPSQGRP
jgi:hypothetical protein